MADIGLVYSEKRKPVTSIPCSENEEVEMNEGGE